MVIGPPFLSRSASFREFLVTFPKLSSEIRLAVIRPNHPIDSSPYLLPSPIPQLTRRVKPVPIPDSPVKTSTKRPLPVETEEGVIDLSEA
jgi:hypothetical protein